MQQAPAHASDDSKSQLARLVDALRRPAAYPGEVHRIEAIETHMSWVFLTRDHAYKLKKPLRTPLFDHTTQEARMHACLLELELNRRLATSVYLAVVPVVAHPTIRVEGAGSPVDWLVKMRRLPRDRMLDVCIEQGTVQRAEIERVGAALTSFYANAVRAPLGGRAYEERILEALASKRESLAQPRYRVSSPALRAAVEAQDRWLSRHSALLRSRADRLVDAHGDLRPEHVCLEEPVPVFIDCLEFDRTLRLLDPVSELSFLSLECRRLSAPWIGAQLLTTYEQASLDRIPRSLCRFYESYHALVRGAVAIWHLDDASLDHSSRWRERAEQYLELAHASVG